MRRLGSKAAALAVCLALCIAAGGCGKSRVPVYPASGKLTVHGKPMERVFVTLVPVNKPEKAPAIYITGITNAEGLFTLSTKVEGEEGGARQGAPQGEYIVLASSPEPGRGGLGARKRSTDTSKAGEGKIDLKYLNPKESPLRATIKPTQANEIVVEIP